EALEPSRVDDPVGFVTQLKSSMGGLLGGLSTAFSTSLFGLTGSVLLGFVDLQTRRARSELLSDLDRFVVSVLAPAASENLSSDPATRPPVMSIIRGSQDDHIYHHASQETLGENLRRLTEVIGQQSAMDERITDSIVEVKGMIEALREQDAQAREAAQSAHLTRQSLLERMDNLGRHMERLVKEVRLAREASDDMGRAVLDRMKLEGEITNKTLSLGFSDLIRSVDRLQERPRTRSDAEREDRS
ncbi:MAG TPA: hypothetical protein VK463_03840, partial [Desulfomonilaceae bacterium]|nr:hypothetical protein [Desulfomonilaceae bacterium]